MEIHTVDDLVRILQEHPEWRERVREALLTDEERRTPDRLRQMQDVLEQIVESHRQAIARLDRPEESPPKLVREVASLRETVAELTSWLKRLSDELGKWRGYTLEVRSHLHAPAILGYYVRRPRVVDLGAVMDDLRESGQEFTGEEWRDIAGIDTLLSAKHPQTGEPIHVAVEVSWMIFPEDIERISRRARQLTERGLKTLPVVTSEGITPDARDLAQQEKARVLLDGSADVLETSWLQQLG
ncbi:MAG: hypothetical protein ACUVRT_01880 [Armatimonadota bacterium]